MCRSMDGRKRREMILEILKRSERSVSGTSLAGRLGVSRQAIVQDIALLKAENKEIMSTNKGYMMYRPLEKQELYSREFCTSHTKEETLDELQIIVDCGGKVIDVSVEHDLYGRISAVLEISNRMEAAEFTEKLKKSKDQPLKMLTNARHYHRVLADSEKSLDVIEEELKKKGYLV